MEINNYFISFEGIDFSGKSTQIEKLTHRLRSFNKTVHVFREPGGTQISELIRKILLDKNNLSMTETTELLLYSAARNQVLSEKILPLLRKGEFIIADRYADSTTAYQGFGRQISLDLIKQVNQIATNGFLPSLTFYLDLQVEEMELRQKRIQDETDRLESSGIDFFKRVREGYLKIADTDTKRIKVINAAQDVSIISDQIWELVRTKMNLNS